MKVLCVHGIGKHDPLDLTWQEAWKSAISRAVASSGKPEPEFSFCLTDDLFVQRPLTFWQTLDAIATLGGSALFGPADRGIFDGDNIVGWTAGMVTQWAGNEELRQATRDRMKESIQKYKPDVIVAHSLGTLIAYDFFSHDDGRSLSKGQTLVTCGSQINSRFVRGVFETGVITLPADARWFHIFNPNDPVFTAEIQFDGAVNFREVVTSPFGSGFSAHTNLDAYLNDSKVLAKVWTPICTRPAPEIEDAGIVPADRDITAGLKLAAKASPTRRALLIGINEYNDPKYRLEGCVNDVYEVSALLQECGFSPDEIRVVFDGRATADGIRERLGWLFNDAQDGDVRFLFYSGHGIQMPIYGRDEKPSRIVEAIVAADFEGTLKNCITDQDLSTYYGKLPQGCHAILALDCCHAGGLTRSGSPRIRGIDPPDDIRHRMLRWDSKNEMWVPRLVDELIPGHESRETRPQWLTDLTGASGCVARIGSSIDHRRISDPDYDHLRSTTGWRGPFQPLVISACRENEKSAEYLHGSVSYGAFTFAFCKTIRKHRHQSAALSYQEAIAEAAAALKGLGYLQNPVITGPTALKEAQIPFLPRSTRGAAMSRRKSTAKVVRKRAAVKGAAIPRKKGKKRP